MTEQHLTIAPFYKGWAEYQQRLVQAIAPLSPDQMALGVGPELRTLGMIATHIVSVRAGWFYYVLLERDERLPELAGWDERERPFRSAAEVVKGLETTWQVIDAALNRWTNADLDDIVWDIDDDGKPVQPYTRQWVIWHLIEHDLHHGGELSFTLGMHGLHAIDL